MQMHSVDAHTESCFRGMSPALWRCLFQDGSPQLFSAWKMGAGWDTGEEAKKCSHLPEYAVGNWQLGEERKPLQPLFPW